MGLLHYFLGLKVHQAEDGIFISQGKYAKDLLSKFGRLNCKPAITPMNINEKLQQEDRGEMADAKRLCGFTESDWASSLDDRRSVSANVFTLGSRVTTWSSKKQATAALSTSEAEYIAATSAACQAIWLRRVLADLQHEKKGATKIFCDNKATITMTKNPTFHGRKKHIGICYHFIRDLVAKEEITLEYCSTQDQLTDVPTKSLPKEKFCYFRALLGASGRGWLVSESRWRRWLRAKLGAAMAEDQRYNMGVIPTRKSLALCDWLSVSCFCRRRLSTVLVHLKFAEHLKEAVTNVEQGHIRVGPETVTDPAFLVTRNMEDFITWVDTSKIRRKVLEYNEKLDDYDAMN
ncbi:uncharacterized protein LOC105801393 [Gossypium raimondii]|nr:uncharacterized protein LOC105801393 [Gossypium raimondii]